MRKSILLTTIFLISIASSAQFKKELSIKDSIELNHALNYLFTAIQSHDTLAIKSVSLPILHCTFCDSGFTKEMEHNFNDFVNTLFRYTYLPRILKEYKYNRYFYHLNRVKDPPVPFIRNIKADDSNIYEVFFEILKPNELSPGHEGADFIFQFVKSNGHFVLFGMMTIP